MSSTFQDQAGTPVTPTMKLGAVVVYVDDVPAVLDFYHRAFGFATRFYDPTLDYGELDTGGTMLAFGSHQVGGFLMPGVYERHAQRHAFDIEVAFETPDVPAAFARAVAAGAAVVAEPKVLPWGATAAYVRSIEGTLIGLGTPVLVA